MKQKWFYSLRIHNQIRQIHASSRTLSEAELLMLPDWAWVDEYYLDEKWSFKSWFKQYDRQKYKLSPKKGNMKKYDSILKPMNIARYLKNPYVEVARIYGIKFVKRKRIPKELSDLLAVLNEERK